MDVVIPVADEQRNETLPRALASLERWAPDLRQVIVGNAMPWVDFGPAAYGIRFDQPRGQAIANTDRAMQLALDDPTISDPFIWSNDDIYWREATPMDVLEFWSATSRGELPKRTTEASGVYTRLNVLTRKLLSAARLPTWDYEMHVPLVVHKDVMRQALALGGSKRSVYGNLLRAEPSQVRQDVKVFSVEDTVRAAPFLSTGNDYPLDAVDAILGA